MNELEEQVRAALPGWVQLTACGETLTFEKGTVWARFSVGYDCIICDISTPNTDRVPGFGDTVQEAFSDAKTRLLWAAHRMKERLDEQVRELEALDV